MLGHWVACLFHMQVDLILMFMSRIFFRSIFLPSADSRRASYQILKRKINQILVNCLQDACPGTVRLHKALFFFKLGLRIFFQNIKVGGGKKIKIKITIFFFYLI